MTIKRKVDELGRIVLPADYREALGLTSRSGVEITLDGDKIILTAEKPMCKLCGSNEDIHPDYPICKKCIAKVSALK